MDIKEYLEVVKDDRLVASSNYLNKNLLNTLSVSNRKNT